MRIGERKNRSCRWSLASWPCALLALVGVGIGIGWNLLTGADSVAQRETTTNNATSGEREPGINDTEPAAEGDDVAAQRR